MFSFFSNKKISLFQKNILNYLGALKVNKLKTFFSFKVKFFRLFLRQFFLKLLMPNIHEVLVSTKFGKMIVDPLDNHVSRQIIKTKNYNPQEITSIKKVIKKTDNLLICGAHIGALAIPLSRYVKKIDAIEASPENFALLKLNVIINECKNIFIHNYAAAESDGSINFILSKENSGGSKRKPRRYKDNYYYDHPQAIKIKSFALDNKFREKFDVIIMDIEGSEFFAMSGMQRMLGNSRIFIFEFIPDHLINVAGVTVEDFLSKIPINNFKHAFFPRHKVKVGIDKLEYMLNLIAKNQSYEDGIILS
jgi:FkbM family methyltransferase